MKLTVAIFAAFVILVLATPAHADVWDLSWLSTTMFGRGPAGEPAADFSASGTTTATISAIPDGIRISFPTPAGQANVSVSQSNVGFPRGNEAIGGAPIFSSREPLLGIVPGTTLGTYTFSGGTFNNPDSFTLALSGGGSGPAGLERFTGTGTRHASATAAEPTSMIVVAAGLLGARILGRRR
jgi:hypothetical protein